MCVMLHHPTMSMMLAVGSFAFLECYSCITIQVKLLIVIIILSIIKTGFYAPLPPQNTQKNTLTHKDNKKKISSSLTMFRWCSPPPSPPPTGCSPPAVSPAGSSGTSLSSEFSCIITSGSQLWMSRCWGTICIVLNQLCLCIHSEDKPYTWCHKSSLCPASILFCITIMQNFPMSNLMNKCVGRFWLVGPLTDRSPRDAIPTRALVEGQGKGRMMTGWKHVRLAGLRCSAASQGVASR